MSLKSLTTAQMVQLSASWVDADADREVFERYEGLRGVLPIVERVHAALSRAQANASTSAGDVQAMTRRMGELDSVHDRMARGIFNMLTALSELSDDAEEGRALIALRNTLFPRGLTVTLLSYAEQAEEIQQIQAGLGEAHHELLRAIPMPHGTMEQAVERWFSSGVELGSLWAQREGRQGDTVSAGDVLRARNQWLGAVRVILAALDMGAVSDADRDRVIGPVRRARDEARALGRAGGSGAHF